MKATTIAVILMTGMFVVAGCSDKTAKTPMDAVKNIVKAMDKGDKDLFLANIQCEDKEMAGAMFDSGAAMADFTKAFEKEYGKDVLKGKGASMTSFPTPEDIDEKVKIEEKDGKTFAVMEGQGQPMPLVEKDGQWKVDMTSAMPIDEKQKAMALEMSKAMADAAIKAKEKIGQDKYKEKPEQIMSEMMADVMGFAMKKANAMNDAPEKVDTPK